LEIDMLGVRRAMKFGLAALAAVVMLAAAAERSYADSGTVRIVVTKAGFVVGVGGGSGTLRFHHRTYRLRVRGLSVGATIGLSRAELIGEASNMRRASDIVGTYSAIGSGVAVAGGGSAARLQNSKGVILELRGRQVGFQFSVAAGGLTISMRRR
jgi:hypothetical protein